MKYRLIRAVTTDECPWLDEELEAGRTVYRFTGVTYGVISWTGEAVTDTDGAGPFYELPLNALEVVT